MRAGRERAGRIDREAVAQPCAPSASAIVVPGVVGPAAPCHVIVQPPDWSADVVGARTGEQDVARRRRSGSTPGPGLEQHRRLGRRPRGRAPRSASEPTSAPCPAGGIGVLEQAQLELDPQDARDGVVDPDAASIVPAARPALTAAWKRGASDGTMTMSMPAEIGGRDGARRSPGSTWSTPAQSDTTKPVNPSSPLRTSVSRWWSPWTLPAAVLENDAMTIRAPASIAAS